MTRHKCQECGKTFDLKRYLTKHEIRMHKNSKNPEQTGLSVEPLKCSMCEKVFPRLSHLQRHQMTHLNVRSFSCEFCDEKFIQKVHLTKHVTRKHAEEAKIEVKWTACDKCGHLFKTSDEMKVHRRTVHELHRCKRCKEVIEAGNDGLRQHHIRCRNRKNICDHCGASFDRPADLFSHQMSCLKKVQFVCKQCDSYFKQRVELDRHFKKFHFQSSKCTNCDYISETPLQNSRHVLSCLNRIICGYCNLENPDKDHVKEMHWRRLERPIPKRVADKINKNAKELRKEIPRTPPEEQLIDKESNNVEDDIDESSEITEIRNQSRQDKYSEEKQIIESEDDDPFFNFSEPSTSQFDFSSTVFGDEDETPEEYLTFSISPKDSDLSYHLRGRLPSELVDLFPELENTSIVLLNSGMSPRCRMDVQVPVSIPNACENEEEMRNWLENVIFLDDDS